MEREIDGGGGGGGAGEKEGYPGEERVVKKSRSKRGGFFLRFFGRDICCSESARVIHLGAPGAAAAAADAHRVAAAVASHVGRVRVRVEDW